ncbi:hypothetical protein evm_006093 [Chilo suppressalis]|nr:hypothetical protein evm_006093 [Chilo suppressalis]
MTQECIKNGQHIEFAWIPAHIGIAGNELADRLARDAISCGDVFPFQNYCLDLLAIPKSVLHEGWEQMWKYSKLTRGKFYAAIQADIPSKPWFFNMKFACRVCLTHHSRMYSILNGPLQKIYENITDVPLVMGDIWPTCVCYICYHMIRKLHKFIDKSLKANELLLQLISSESVVRTNYKHTNISVESG